MSQKKMIMVIMLVEEGGWLSHLLKLGANLRHIPVGY